jgi:nitroreductase
MSKSPMPDVLAEPEHGTDLVSGGRSGMKRKGEQVTVGRVVRGVLWRGQNAARLSWAAFLRPFALLGTRSRLFASFYYLLFSGAFRRENRAVLCGRLRYAAMLAAPTTGFALLRRNIHRLEKGLLMVPRRPVFAVDYIQETAECFEKIVASGKCAVVEPNSEMQWAYDVLTKYFQVTQRHPRTESARAVFERLAQRMTACRTALVPYKRELEKPCPVTFEALLALSRRRRSVRWFLQQAVPRELIRRAMEVATQSPSACNRQPFVFYVIDESQLLRSAVSLPLGTGGYEHNIPVLVVVVGQLRNYFSERDRHLIYIDASLAAMSFVLALETLGLSSCMINWADVEDRERKMAELLNLEQDERPILCMAIGYPNSEGLVAYSQKKSGDAILRFNRE